MRLWFAALVLALFACTPGAPPSGHAPALTHEELAGRALRVILVDSGAMEAVSRAAFTRIAASTRSDVQASPNFAGLSSAAKMELLGFIDSWPASASATVVQNAPNVLPEFAPRLASMFDERELHEITEYYQSPAGRSWMLRGAVAEAQGNHATPTAEEARAMEQFSATHAGRAMSDEFNKLLYDAGARVIAVVSEQVSASLHQGVCSRIPCEPSP